MTYQVDARTGKPLRFYGNFAIVLNDDGTRFTEHRDADGRLYSVTSKHAPYPEDAMNDR